MTDRSARNLNARPLGPDSDKHERPRVRPLAKIQSFVRETGARDTESGIPTAPISQRRLKRSEAEGPCTEPARIVTIDSSGRTSEIHHTIDDRAAAMRECFSQRDYVAALTMANLILAAQPNNPIALEFRANSRAALEDVYAFQLGPLDRVPVIVMLREQTGNRADNRIGVLLPLIDGSSTLEAIVDVCGMPRLDALRSLNDLVQRGIVTFG
jgi:hypothetical protein